MAWAPEYEPYPRSRNSPTRLLLAILAGVAIGGGVFYYFKGNPFANNAPLNDPNAQPRAPEPKSEMDFEESQASRVFESASASVVNIDTLQMVRNFDMSVQQRQTGTGSGFVWDGDGRIVTNYHVVAPAYSNRAKLRVVFADRQVAEAVIVGVAPDYDLAVIQVVNSNEKFKPIRIGTSKDLKIGQKAFAIGNPFGLSLTLTKGIISALNREIDSPGDRPISGAIQTDAPINPGNSGGPLLDKDGRLIGVNASIASPSGGNVGIGFAIPVDTVNEIVPKIIAKTFVRPDAGVKLVDQRILLQNGIRHGAMIAEVTPGGPADQAGLVGLKRNRNGRYDPGDLIIAINGNGVAGNAEFLKAIALQKPGDTLTLTVERNEKTRDVEVTLMGI